jgi:hypothetical protein
MELLQRWDRTPRASRGNASYIARTKAALAVARAPRPHSHPLLVGPVGTTVPSASLAQAVVNRFDNPAGIEHAQ